MKVKQLTIINRIITVCYIIANVATEQLFDGDFYQDVTAILFIGAVLEIYLNELEDESI